MKKYILLMILLAGMVSADWTYDFSLASEWNDFENWTCNNGVQDFSVGGSYLHAGLKSTSGTGYGHIYSPSMGTAASTWGIKAEMQNMSGNHFSVGVWSSYWDYRCGQNVKPLSVAVRTCDMGVGVDDCCVWVTNTSSGSAPFEAYVISYDALCTAYEDDNCTFTASSDADSNAVFVELRCDDVQGGGFVWSENEYHDSMFSSYTLYGGTVQATTSGSYVYNHIDSMNYSSDTDNDSVDSCYVDLSSIVRSNKQTAYVDVTGTPTNVLFDIDGTNYTYEGSSGDTYYYDWEIDAETLGQHNITCHVVFPASVLNDTTNFQVTQAAVTVTVYDSNDNVLPSVDVYVLQNSTNLTSEVTDLNGQVTFNLTGDKQYSYQFVSEGVSQSLTVRNSSSLEIYTSSLYGTFVIHPYINNIWDDTTCGPQNYMTFDSLYGDTNYSISGLDCGSNVYYLNVEAGTYIIGWTYGLVNVYPSIEPLDPPSIWGGDYEDVFVYGFIDWEELPDEPSDPTADYDTTNYLFTVYDETTFDYVENATIMVFECVEFQTGLICEDPEGTVTTNSTGQAYMEASYEEYNKITVSKNGYVYYEEIITPDSEKYDTVGGCGEGSCGNVDILVNYTAYIVPTSHYYFTVDVEDCSDSSNIENASVTCNTFSRSIQGKTNGNGQVNLTMPIDDMTSNPFGLYATCQISYLDYLPRSFQEVYVPFETYEYCLDALTDSYNLGVNITSGTDNVSNAKVTVTCYDSVIITDVVYTRTGFTDSEGDAYFTGLPRRDCNVFVSKSGYMTNQTNRFYMNAHQNVSLSMYQSVSGQNFLASYVDTYGETSLQVLNDVRVTWYLYNDSSCTNQINEIARFTQNGHAELELWVNSGTYFRVIGSKEGYENYVTGCYNSAYAHQEQFYMIPLEGELTITFKPRQLCNNTRVILNDVWFRTYSMDTGYQRGPFHINEYQYGITMDSGTYRIEANKIINGTEVGAMEVTRTLIGTGNVYLDFEQCFLGTQQDVLDAVERDENLQNARQMAFNLLPLFVLLLLLGAIRRV